MGAASAVASNSKAYTADVSHGIATVIRLLSGMETEITKEGQDHAVLYDKYACYCKEQASNKLYAIDQSDKMINELDASIAAAEAKIAKLTTKIKENKDEIEKKTEEIKVADALRKANAEAYKEALEDMDIAIKAITKAHALIQEKADMKLQKLDGVASLIQKSAVVMKVAAAVGADVSFLASPDKVAYPVETILSLLANLLKTFKTERDEMMTEEATNKFEYQKERNADSLVLKTNTELKEERETMKAETETKKNEETELRTREKEDRDTDKTFIDHVTEQCKEKAEQYDREANARAGELKAIKEAIAELQTQIGSFIQQEPAQADAAETEETTSGEESESESDDDMSDLAETDSEGSESESSFVQTSNPRVQKVVQMLFQRSKKVGSVQLAALALRSSNAKFGKVKDMIKTLIEDLKAQLAANQTHFDMCKKEMKAAIEKRDDSQAEIESENAEIYKNEKTIKELTELIQEKETEKAEAIKTFKELTETRNAEKAANMATIKLAKEQYDSIAQAIKILKKVYASGAFVQTQQEPIVRDRDGNTMEAAQAYQTKEEDGVSQKKGDSVIGLLNALADDAELTKTTTDALEKKQSEDYDEDKTEHEVDVKRLNGLIKKAEEDKAKEESAMDTNKEELEDQTTLNKAAKAELKILTGECIDPAVSREERTQRREQEIAALKDALKVLEASDSTATLTFLQKK